MEIVDIPSSLESKESQLPEVLQFEPILGTYRHGLHFGDLGNIILVIDTITQDVAKVP